MHYISTISRKFTFTLFILFASTITAIVPFQAENGKWGFSASDGTISIKPMYSEIIEDEDGIFRVAVGGKVKNGVLTDELWGIIDSYGKNLLPPVYEEIGDFDNGLMIIKKNGKYGFVNNEYKLVIDTKYDYVGNPNSQGYVWVNIGGKPDKTRIGNFSGGKFGIFNATGKAIIPPQYTSVGYFQETISKYTQEQIYSAKSPIERLQLECGSHLSLWAKPIEYYPGYRMPEAIGFAFSTKNSLIRNGITNLEGNILIKNDEYQKCAYPTDGCALVITKTNLLGYHNISTDQFVVNAKIKTAFSFKDGFAVCIDNNNQWQLYDTGLNPAGDCYDWISPRQGDYYIVKKQKNMFLIGARDFNTVFEGAEFIFPPSNGIMVFKDAKSGLWGFLNISGQVAVAPVYQYAYSFNHGASMIKGDNGWGMLDTRMKERITPQWNSIHIPVNDGFNNVWAETTLNGNTVCICLDWNNGKPLFDRPFSEAWNFKNIGGEEFAVVADNDKYGCIDAKGNIVIPLIMRHKSMADAAIDYVKKYNIKQWAPIIDYRFNLYYSNSRNSHTLHDFIPETDWDF